MAMLFYGECVEANRSGSAATAARDRVREGRNADPAQWRHRGDKLCFANGQPVRTQLGRLVRSLHGGSLLAIELVVASIFVDCAEKFLLGRAAVRKGGAARRGQGHNREELPGKSPPEWSSGPSQGISMGGHFAEVGHGKAAAAWETQGPNLLRIETQSRPASKSGNPPNSVHAH